MFKAGNASHPYTFNLEMHHAAEANTTHALYNIALEDGADPLTGGFSGCLSLAELPCFSLAWPSLTKKHCPNAALQSQRCIMIYSPVQGSNDLPAICDLFTVEALELWAQPLTAPKRAAAWQKKLSTFILGSGPSPTLQN